MKTKHIIALLLLGLSMFVVASTFKILHLQGSTVILLASGILIALGCLLGAWKVLFTDKFQDFLNR